MALPAIDDDQRTMAVAMLANALRSVGHLDGHAEAVAGEVAFAASAGRRAEAARRYVGGMVDLLAVLFAEGRPGAEALLAEATAVARGERPLG